MSLLRENWAVSTFGEICDYVQRGKSPKYAEASDLPVINQKAIRWFGLQDEYLKYVHPEQIDSWTPERYIRLGDVLWNSTGTGTIGRACLIRVVNLDSPKVVDSHVTILRSNPEIDPRYLFYWIMGPTIQERISDLSTGTTNQVELNRQIVLETKIPVPPLAEQKRIADKLDQTLAIVERAKARLARVPEILKQFRQSVLAAATYGRLTEDWRESQSVFREAPISVNSPENVMPFFDIPGSWKWSKISNIGLVKGGKRLPKGESLLSRDTGYPYLVAGQLKNGTVSSDNQQYLTEELHEKLKRYTVRSGDVFITIVGACIGDSGVIPAKFDGANLTENAAKICNLKGASSSYLAYWLRSNICQEFIRFSIKSGAQGKLALCRIEEIPVPLPPDLEQQEILRRIDILFAVADRIEVRYQAISEKVDKLTQALLAKAFRGELVPQDPNDEPASVLLERIRAQRRVQPSTKSISHRKMVVTTES